MWPAASDPEEAGQEALREIAIPWIVPALMRRAVSTKLAGPGRAVPRAGGQGRYWVRVIAMSFFESMVRDHSKASPMAVAHYAATR